MQRAIQHSWPPLDRLAARFPKKTVGDYHCDNGEILGDGRKALRSRLHMAIGWVIVERWYPNLKQGYRQEIRSAAFSTKEAASNFAATLNAIHDGGILHVVTLSELSTSKRTTFSSTE